DKNPRLLSRLPAPKDETSNPGSCSSRVVRRPCAALRHRPVRTLFSAIQIPRGRRRIFAPAPRRGRFLLPKAAENAKLPLPYARSTDRSGGRAVGPPFPICRRGIADIGQVLELHSEE